MKYTGTIARGIKAPLIKKGDNIIEIVNQSLLNVVENDGVVLNDGDIICITESVVAIAQKNFATTSQIAKSITDKLGENKTIGILFPIMSRNRFSMLLKGICNAAKKVVLQLSYPADEVGNKIITEDELIDANINPYTDLFTSKDFKKIFKNTTHEYTGIDYIKFYEDIIGEKGNVILSNDPKHILRYTDNVIVSSTHSRKRLKKDLFKAGGKWIFSLDDILTEPVNGSGYNPEFGLLGANLAREDSVKLFPRDSENTAYKIQEKLKKTFGKNIEVMVYGDGAYKDPQGEIWELCDPVVSPGYTKGLEGTPNEVKLKYLVSKGSTEASVKKQIKEKATDLVGKFASQGTTPRKIVDLLGSLADLTSGSGDKGTPFVLIQNYFNNFASEEIRFL